MLILFDIDATMITTGGVGIRAMVAAGRHLFGPGFNADGIDFAGRLDPLILNEMLERSGVARTAENMASIRREYGARLQGELDQSDKKRVLPGVLALLARLGREPSATRGVLTGNFCETGRMKLSACGIDPHQFEVQVWGDESPHDPPQRSHLPPVGMARYRALRGSDVPACRVTIIGDTPHDVGCARAHGCRSLGVATGKFGISELAAAGADRVAPDLSDTGAIFDWLLKC